MGKKRKYKQKKWHERRCRKLQKKWYGRDDRIRSWHISDFDAAEESYNGKHQFIAKMPSNFSFISNAENTISYFDKLISVIIKKRFKQKFFIDARDVNSVTAETLIYMIAIIYNIKANKPLQYEFEGNLPITKSAKEAFQNSGYLNYFKMKKLKMPDSSSRVQIVSGKNVETETAKAICDFAIDKLGVTRTKMRVLYATLIELMSNTAKHAYQDNNTRMIAQWYLHALYDDDKISVSFMDTGEGIPNTLKKKIIERVFQLPDSQLIELSLTERGRSETGLPNRGRGLPNLFQHVKKNEINDFYVLSGSGSCIYSQEDGKLILQEYEHNIYGTIFNFSFKKESLNV